MTTKRIPKCKCCGHTSGLIFAGEEYVCGEFLLSRIKLLERVLDDAAADGAPTDEWIAEAERQLKLEATR